MSKIYNVFVSKEVVKDNWNDGEIGPRTSIYCNEFYGKEGSLKEALENAAEYVLDQKVELKDFSYVDGTSTAVYARTESNGEIPTEEELADWKAGKIDLDSAEYYFRVMVSNEVDKEEFIALGITE